MLTSFGFIRGRASPCVFWHQTRKIRAVCHGDDFAALRCKEDLDWYEKCLSSSIELGETIRMGEADSDAKEARILNRILRLDSAGLKCEADQAQHAQQQDQRRRRIQDVASKPQEQAQVAVHRPCWRSTQSISCRHGTDRPDDQRSLGQEDRP